MAARRSLEVLSNVITDASVQRVTSDNFSGIVELLDVHAELASKAVKASGRQDRRRQSETPVLSVPLSYQMLLHFI